MSDSWYTTVSPDTPLTQGDIILHCPVLAWKPEPIEALSQAAVDAISADIVVMTQACDLAHNKVSNVIACKHAGLSEFQVSWKEEMERQRQNPTPKAWRRFCEDVRDGFVWNLALLSSSELMKPLTEHRVVDFHEIFSTPRSFLEPYLLQRGEPRLRLLPPYREHLSQAFARFFMRVGLPAPVADAW